MFKVEKIGSLYHIKEKDTTLAYFRFEEQTGCCGLGLVSDFSLMISSEAKMKEISKLAVETIFKNNKWPCIMFQDIYDGYIVKAFKYAGKLGLFTNAFEFANHNTENVVSTYYYQLDYDDWQDLEAD